MFSPALVRPDILPEMMPVSARLAGYAQRSPVRSGPERRRIKQKTARLDTLMALARAFMAPESNDPALD